MLQQTTGGPVVAKERSERNINVIQSIGYQQNSDLQDLIGRLEGIANKLMGYPLADEVNEKEEIATSNVDLLHRQFKYRQELITRLNSVTIALNEFSE